MSHSILSSTWSRAVMIVLILAFTGTVIAQSKAKENSEEVQKWTDWKNERYSDQVDSRVWSIQHWKKWVRSGLVQVAPDYEPAEAIHTGHDSQVTPELMMVDGPDVAVTSISNTTQSENSIFVDPNNNQKVLQSNNSTDNPVTQVYGTSGFMSSDGGATYSGSVNGTGGGNGGDPAALIGLNGRYYVGYIASNSGQGVAYSTNEGSSWTHVQAGGAPGGFNSLLDKNHAWVDNSSSSPHEGNVYAAWTRFETGHPNDLEIEIVRSTNDGVSYSSPINVSSAVNAGSHNQGVNIQTGPSGEVYVLWTIYDSWPTDEDALAMSISTNGGVSYSTATRIHNNIRGIRNTATSKNMRVSSFPSMAVDISGGPNNGNIYIVWSNIGVPGVNTGSDIDVYMMRSTNGGSSWDTPIRVNQDGPGSEHFFPWITCDPVTGDLSVVYYDDRNVSSSQCEVYVSYSQDAGSSWTDMKVSDVAFTPAPIPGLATGYFGDYLGISANNGRVYPVWTDNRDGRANAYISPFDLGGAGGNISPTADANGPYTGTTGVSVSFSSAGSSDPDGSITGYLWNFGDGNTSTSANPSHTYNTAGSYNVSLTVTDNEGATGVDNTTATISDPTAYASLPYSTGFESGSLDQYWTTASTSDGRVLITTSNGPRTGSWHMTMDDPTSGGFVTNEAWLHLDLAGESGVTLDFWWKEYGDETHADDGVYFSDNGGTSFVKVQDLNGSSFTNQTWNEFNLDVDALASSNGLSLSSTFVIKFQQYDNYPIATDGHAYDDIEVSAGGAVNQPPTADANGPYTGTTNVSVSFSSAGSSDPDGTITNYLWEFGDGNTSTGANPSHTYSSAGTYNVSLTVTDDGGLQDTDNTTATISDPPGGDYATLPYSTGFEGGSLDQYWTTGSDNDGRVLITTANTPHSGSYHLTMDDAVNAGTFATNDADLHLDLSGETSVQLNFWWKEFGDETHSQDGVYFSDDGGSSFTKVQDLNGQSYTNNTWVEFTLDVDALASANGISLSSTFVIRWEQYDNYAITTDGHAIDDISVTDGGGGGGGDYATLPYSTGFESGSLDQYWTTNSTNDGRVLVTSSNTPHSGTYHLTMDDAVNGGTFATNDADLHLDLAGETSVELNFWWKEFGDETHSQDGVYFSDDGGSSFTKVQDLNGQSYTNNTWTEFTLDVDALASANGLSLSATFVIRWEQYDNYIIATDGHAIDDISVTAGGGGGSYITAESEDNGSSGSADGLVGSGVDVAGDISSSTDDDWFYFDVTSTGNVNVSVAIGSTADLDWYLYHESDLVNWVARGYTTANPEAGTYNATTTGRYYLWVDGYQGATSGYTLSVSGGLAKFLNTGPEKDAILMVYGLDQNYPNPFNPTTTIQIALPERSDVSVKIYDITGRLVRTLIDDAAEAGYHSFKWDGTSNAGVKTASGIYIYRMQANSTETDERFVETKRMMLLK